MFISKYTYLKSIFCTTSCHKSCKVVNSHANKCCVYVILAKFPLIIERYFLKLRWVYVSAFWLCDFSDSACYGTHTPYLHIGRLYHKDIVFMTFL